MPPRTGPRRKRRKIGAPAALRHFAVVRGDEGRGHPRVGDIIVAHRIELAEGNLVFRDGHDAISHILAEGEWRDVHPATMGELAVMDDNPGGTPEPDNREQASLVNENDPPFQPTRKEEQDHRFVPSSPEEAQRILMELERRLAPESDPDQSEVIRGAPTAPPRKD